MAVFGNTFSLPDLLGPLRGNIESVLPGSTSSNTLIGNVIGTSGVVEDVEGGVSNGSPSTIPPDVYGDVFTTGGVVQDLSDGSGLGIENTLAQHLPPIDDVPGVSQALTALDPVTDVVDNVNNTLVTITEDLSPGTSSPYVLTGNIIGPQGIVDDVVNNFHEGSLSGAVLDVYKDVLGFGGIINNLGDGLGTGLEVFVHNLDGAEGQVPLVDQIPALLGDTPNTLTDTLEDLSPGASNTNTLTGNIFGDQGVVEDVLSNLQGQSLTGALVDSYDDTFAPGGIINNLADGHGLGIESLVSNGPGILDGLPLLSQSGGGGGGDLLSGALDHVAALVGGDSSSDGGGLPLGAIGGLLGAGDLASVIPGLDLFGGDHSA